MRPVGLGKSVMEFGQIFVADNAEYKCKVDFGTNFGSVFGPGLKQYIREVDTGVTGTQYALVGTAVTHTCTVHGDILSKNVVWTNTAGALAEGGTYPQATVAYSETSFTTTSTLTISALAAADTTSFTCTVEYTNGPVTKAGNIDMNVLCKLSKCC